MPIFCLNSLLKLLNLYKNGNHQNHFNFHVIKFLVSVLIVKVWEIIGKIF
jgi:hypothetical protein